MSISEPASASGPSDSPSSRNARRRNRGRWAVVGAYMLAIFVASSQSRLPELPGLASDKVEHFAAYAGLSLLVVRALTRGAWARATVRTVFVATAVCAAYGLSDEFHQRFVPDRTFDLVDLAADIAGAAAAAGAAWAWGIILRGSGLTHDS